MFIDRAVVQLIAGKGGNGLVAWRREKYIPKGGPSGGNGGRGGDVIFVADPQIPSLDAFRHKRILKAENGQNGGTNLKQGRSGTSLEIKVPCGTLAKDSTTGEVLFDFVEAGQRWVPCVGGRGGRGNHSFRNPTRQAPNFATPGTEGGTLGIELELKLIADIGLVGFPNAGKSTLFKALTHVPVKIAAYPFTTLHPNLGYVDAPNHRRLFIADIPGIIEGAHKNKGLGFEFLRHIERTSLLLIVIDGSGIDGRSPAEDLQVVLDELRLYNALLEQRPILVALNKVDDENTEIFLEDFKASYPFSADTLFVISALQDIGLQKLREAIYGFFPSLPSPAPSQEYED